MTDPRHPSDAPSIPEPGTAPEPSFDEPQHPAPEVVEPPARSTEF